MGFNRKKVIVGMSGGVDSSVTAALLKNKGYAVTGVFIRMWKEAAKQKIGSADEKAARKVAEKLGIEFKAIDVKEQFKKTVIKYFLEEYGRGKTPNPCVFCNVNFKFKLLLEIADKIGAKYVATGHYALVKKLKVNKKNTYKLFEAKDKNKDQSYFLYRLNQKQLARIIFPMGEYEKSEVRKLAKKFKLEVFDKKESQDICFLQGRDTAGFLKNNLKLKTGDISNQKGEIIGSHNGLAIYTAGQRKCINIGGIGPYYVTGKNYKENRLVVTNNPNSVKLYSKSAILENVNWISGKPELPLKAKIRTRYRNTLTYATIKLRINADEKYTADKTRKSYVVEFETPQRAVTPGQSVVFYAKKGEVLGGGIVLGLE